MKAHMVNVSVRRQIIEKILGTMRDMMLPMELVRYSFEFKRQSIKIMVTEFIIFELPIIYKPNTVFPRKFKGLNSLKNFVFANIDIDRTIYQIDKIIFNQILESKRRYTNMWWGKNTIKPKVIFDVIKVVKYKDRIYNVEKLKQVIICKLKRKKS